MRQTDADGYAQVMQTVRTTLNLNAELLERVQRRFPRETKTHLIELGLQALLERSAAQRLIAMGGRLPRAAAGRRRRKRDGAG